MGNVLLSKLKSDEIIIAEQFQRLIVQNYRSQREEWSGAHELLQDLGERMRCLLLPNTTSDPIAAAKTLNINVRFFESRVPRLCGALFPVAGGFESAVYRRGGGRQSLSPEERFTIAHECGHSFFYYSDGRTPKRIIPRLLQDGNVSGEPLEEVLCDAFARALLVPLTKYSDVISKEPALSELLSLAVDFDVPLEALLGRIISDLNAWPRTAIYRIRFDEGVRHVKVIRGAESLAVSCDVLSKEKTTFESVEPAIAHLKRQFQIGDENIAKDGQVVWLRL